MPRTPDLSTSMAELGPAARAAARRFREASRPVNDGVRISTGDDPTRNVTLRIAGLELLCSDVVVSEQLEHQDVRRFYDDPMSPYPDRVVTERNLVIEVEGAVVLNDDAFHRSPAHTAIASLFDTEGRLDAGREVVREQREQRKPEAPTPPVVVEVHVGHLQGARAVSSGMLSDVPMLSALVENMVHDLVTHEEAALIKYEPENRYMCSICAGVLEVDVQAEHECLNIDCECLSRNHVSILEPDDGIAEDSE